MRPSSSQIRVTTWLHLAISKPYTRNSHLTLLYSSGRVPWAKHMKGLIFVCTTQDTPGPAHLVDSYRLHQRTTTLPLHSWSSTDHGRQRLVVSGNSQSLQLTILVNPSCWSANSNQGSATRGHCTQWIQRAHLEYPAWVIGEAVPLDPKGHLIH